jgi:anti-sigma B factor antagonist
MWADSIPSDPNRLQLFEVVGRIDNDSVMALATALENAVASGRDQLVLDLSDVAYINSAGLRELVQIFKRIQRTGGMLVIVNPSEFVRKPLELVGLDSIFNIHMDPLWDASRLTSPQMPSVPRQLCYYG